MALYSFICKSDDHSEPLVIEIEHSIKEEIPTSVSCPVCKKAADRHYPGQKFYAKVPGAHGGGPATR